MVCSIRTPRRQGKLLEEKEESERWIERVDQWRVVKKGSVGRDCESCKGRAIPLGADVKASKRSFESKSLRGVQDWARPKWYCQCQVPVVGVVLDVFGCKFESKRTVNFGCWWGEEREEERKEK